jgi:hypothetical protein
VLDVCSASSWEVCTTVYPLVPCCVSNIDSVVKSHCWHLPNAIIAVIHSPGVACGEKLPPDSSSTQLLLLLPAWVAHETCGAAASGGP